MLHLNLFYEQQQIQREKDYDPVRLTIMGGILMVMAVGFWSSVLYLKMGPLRNDLNANRGKLDKLQKEYKDMGQPTNLPKIQGQAQALNNRVMNRAIFANQLEGFREMIPTNCQLRVFKTRRGFSTIKVQRQAENKKGEKITLTSEKLAPSLELIFEIHTQASTKVAVLQIRDSFLESLRVEPRLRGFVAQVAGEEGNTNLFNQVFNTQSTAQDPQGGSPAIGIFEFKLPIALKDEPKEM